MMAIVGTLAFNFQVVIPLLVQRTFTATTGRSRCSTRVLSVGSLAGALLWRGADGDHPQRRHRPRTASGCRCCSSRPRPPRCSPSPSALLVGGASIAFMTASTSIVQTRADPQMRGRVLALQAMVFLGSTPIGGPLLGYMCQHFKQKRSLDRRYCSHRCRRVWNACGPGQGAGRPAGTGRRVGFAPFGKTVSLAAPTGRRPPETPHP